MESEGFKMEKSTARVLLEKGSIVQFPRIGRESIVLFPRIEALFSKNDPFALCYKYEQPNLGESVTMEDFAQYKAQAKADLTRDTNLDKAADLVAQRNILLANPDIPDALKAAQLK